MIRATLSGDDPLALNVTVRGLAIYLDNWAIGELAEGDPSRRRRFIAALRSGVADLMFSVTNAVELAGPQGASFDTVKSFLNEIGPNWFPVELNVLEVMQREQSGAGPGECCLSQRFARAYFQNRTASYLPRSGKVINPPEVFSGLGAVLDWVGSARRDEILRMSAELDERWGKELSDRRATYTGGPLPVWPFDPTQPATFAAVHLVRTLITESHAWKKGDGLDFCHAVMGSSYASIAALDKRWKRRVEGLPKPNGLARRIYCGPELDQMVTDVESCVKQRNSS